MGSKIRNIAFAAIFCLLVGVLPLGNVALRVARVWDGNEPWWKSYLESEDATRPTPSVGRVLSGMFQDEMETYLRAHYPYRDTILLDTAALQRQAIEPAAQALGYPAWITYYGSVFYYAENHDCIVIRPTPVWSQREVDYERAVDTFRSFTERHADVPVYIYAFANLGESQYGPVHELCGPVIDEPYLREHLYEPLQDDLTVVYEDISSQEELLSQMWRTNHHWQVSLAYAGYEQLLAELLPGEEPTAYEVLDLGLDMYGSYARVAACPTVEPDHFYDWWVDTSGLRVTADGEEEPSESLDAGWAYLEDAPFNAYYDHYNVYWHGNYGTLCIENPEAPHDETLVIVGDSYASPTERFFAMHYARVVRLDPRYTDVTLDEAVELYDPCAVVFIQDENSLISAEDYAFLQPA